MYWPTNLTIIKSLGMGKFDIVTRGDGQYYWPGNTVNSSILTSLSWWFRKCATELIRHLHLPSCQHAKACLQAPSCPTRSSFVGVYCSLREACWKTLGCI